MIPDMIESGVEVFDLVPAGRMNGDGSTFEQRSNVFGSSISNGDRGVALMVWRDERGLHSRIVLEPSADAAGVAMSLAQTVAARSVESGSWPVLDGSRVAWLVADAGRRHGRSTQVGSDPAEVSRAVASAMMPGMWMVVLLRGRTQEEANRHDAWISHRLQVPAVTLQHHSVKAEALAMSVCAGGASAEVLRTFLRKMATVMPGFDVPVRVVVESSRSVASRRFVQAGVAVAGVVGLRVVPPVSSWVGWGVSDARVVGVLQHVVGWLGWLLAGVVVGLVVVGVRGWRGAGGDVTSRVSRAVSGGVGAGVFPAPGRAPLRVRAPREASTQTQVVSDGNGGSRTEVRRVSAHPGDYPFDGRVFSVGPSVVTGLVAPHGGAVSGVAESSNGRGVSPALLADVGPWVADAVVEGELVRVHVDAKNLRQGFASTGEPGSGKTKMVNAVWAWVSANRCFGDGGREGLLGRRVSSVYFDTRGLESPHLRRWAALTGDEVVFMDARDPSTPAIDLFADRGGLDGVVKTFVDAMVFSFHEGEIMGASKEVLSAVLAAGVVFDDEMCEAVNASCPGTFPVGASPVWVAWVACGGRGREAQSQVWAVLDAAANGLLLDDPLGVRTADVVEARARLSVFHVNVSDSARETRMQAARNKLDQLRDFEYWWSRSRVKVSWDRVLDEHMSVVVNTGLSQGVGLTMSEGSGQILGSMLSFFRREAVQRVCAGWEKQDRWVAVFSDELTEQATHSSEVFEWDRDKGRAYGVLLVLATQRLDQLSPALLHVFVSLLTFMSFKQAGSTAAKDAAAELGLQDGEWSGENILGLDKSAYEAVVRTSVGGRRQPGVLVRVPNFEERMVEALGVWGFDVSSPGVPLCRGVLSAAAGGVGDAGAGVGEVGVGEVGVDGVVGADEVVASGLVYGDDDLSARGVGVDADGDVGAGADLWDEEVFDVAGVDDDGGVGGVTGGGTVKGSGFTSSVDDDDWMDL